jgi:hypothetical protein
LINLLYETVIQEQTPPQTLGHLLGAVQPVSMAGMPVGTVLAGIAVQALGVLPTNAGMGVISLDK